MTDKYCAGYTDEPEPWRRLACALLLGGAVGAYKHVAADIAWVASDEAKVLAELLDLPDWPPRPEQLASRLELTRRAHVYEDLDRAPADVRKRERSYRAYHKQQATPPAVKRLPAETI